MVCVVLFPTQAPGLREFDAPASPLVPFPQPVEAVMKKHDSRPQALVKQCQQLWNECCDLGWSTQEWADHAGVCPATVHNLVFGITIYPRWETVYRLGKAVGLQLKLQEKPIAKRLRVVG